MTDTAYAHRHTDVTPAIAAALDRIVIPVTHLKRLYAAPFITAASQERVNALIEELEAGLKLFKRAVR